jgi:hypothetical protein
LAVGKGIYLQYFELYAKFKPSIIEEFKLGQSDVGWYQIRNALKEHNHGKDAYTDQLKDSYGALTAQLSIDIYEFGFLE